MTDAAQQIIEAAEGISRLAKPDTRGFLTIAIGCMCDPRGPNPVGLCDAAIEAQFANDSALARQRAANIPGFAALNPVQQGVIVSMCFQLGALANWPQFRAALAIGDLQGAQAAGLNSDWFHETPIRAKWELGMLRTGIFVPYPV